MPSLVRPLGVRHENSAAIWAVDVHPSLPLFATGGGDNVVCLWPLAATAPGAAAQPAPAASQALEGHQGSVNAVRFSRAGDLASGSDDHNVRSLRGPRGPMGCVPLPPGVAGAQSVLAALHTAPSTAVESVLREKRSKNPCCGGKWTTAV